MNRSILIITPFFAPQSHAAVFRAYKLAKYLPQYDWKVRVITTDTNYLYNEDSSLLHELSDEIEIYRTRYIEPTMRGLRMALGGKDRTFKATKSDIRVDINKKSNAISVQPGHIRLVQRLYTYLLDRWLYNPDMYWTWQQPTVKLAEQLIRNHNIPLVYTSALPYTSNHIGYSLKKKTDVRWVADFRDPGTHAAKMTSAYDHVFLKQQKAEKLAVRNADAITVLSQSYRLILTEMYDLSNNHPIHFITTGLDEKLLGSFEADLPLFPYILFVGEYIPSYDEKFFRIFSSVLKNPLLHDTAIKLLIIGNIQLNRPRLRNIITKYELQSNVEFIDHVPQQTLYQYLQHAEAALLVPGEHVMWWNLFAKLVDYIGLQKPTISIVPNPSEARMHLEESNLGVFLDGDDALATRTLTEFLLSDKSTRNVNVEYCKQFLAQSQVKSFIGVFENLM